MTSQRLVESRSQLAVPVEHALQAPEAHLWLVVHAVPAVGVHEHVWHVPAEHVFWQVEPYV